jgi:predicted glycogen debranching enzyme
MNSPPTRNPTVETSPSAPSAPTDLERQTSLGREVLNDYQEASRREWLVTNGIGGYASASLAGANTRRYHGILVAAVTPPTGRFVAVSRLEETVSVGEGNFQLAANQYPGVIHPTGYELLARFSALPVPTFYFELPGGGVLEKQIWMAYGRNTTYVRYRMLGTGGAVTLTLTPLVCWKDYHTEFRQTAAFPNRVEVDAGALTIHPGDGAAAITLTAEAPNGVECLQDGCWYHDFEHLRELERGQEWREDLYCPSRIRVSLVGTYEVTFIATTERETTPAAAAWNELLDRQERLVNRGAAVSGFRRSLVLASDVFVVERGTREPGDSNGEEASPSRSTIIAGYPWFTDWGRDTMISLPGLCLVTGRHAVAREILTSYAAFVSQGMIPNRFPDQSEEPEYNTVDATLWYLRAIWDYLEATGDLDLVRELWPTIVDILRWHQEGTRYGIHMDPADGLITAGEEGVQLTWMDAKCGDWVVTPRIGKPVEINALWHDALVRASTMAERIGEDMQDFASLADRAAQSFRAGFIRPDGRGLYDVLTPDGPDGSVRPNQIFAVSLNSGLLPRDMEERVLSVIERELLTPIGLRTLSPDDPAYQGRYEGDMRQRDGAYHQGTVWPWLLGPFVRPHFRLYGDRAKARAFLAPLEEELARSGCNSLAEVYDGDPPQRPDGCIAQAWSIAETLAALDALEQSAPREQEAGLQNPKSKIQTPKA